MDSGLNFSDQKTNPQKCIRTADGLPLSGFVRLRQILQPDGPLPISKSSWWAGIKAGRYPKPIKIGPRTTVWLVDDIRALIADLLAGRC